MKRTFEVREVWRQRDGVEIEAGTRVPRKNSRKIRTMRSSKTGPIDAGPDEVIISP